MKIGIWVNEPLNKISGGGFTYFNALIAGIDNFNFGPEMEIVLLSAHDLSGFSKQAINVKPHQREHNVAVKLFRKGLKIISKTAFRNWISLLDQKEKKKKDHSIAGYLKTQGVKIIFYPLPCSAVIGGIPYMVNNWDLAHYTTYAFPETVDDGGFDRRNEWYKNVMPSALMILCESEAGKREIVRYLSINPDKIKILPLFCSDAFIRMQVAPAEQEKNLANLGLTAGKFFFYPAQFWAHKNHYHLVMAFAKFVKTYPEHKLLFCGSDKGNIDYIKTLVQALKLEQSVIFGGFIEDDALFSLYKNASAMVMPTFFGPTNIPPIEAMFLGCPALLSDIEGHREIMADGALYFDPLDDEAIFESMEAIMDDQTRKLVIANQEKQAKITPHSIEKALIKLEAHFYEAINIRNCWE
ncbi:MAG TPA: glycosyltransferase family 1 protein [Mucilaginibacter sp.]|jgi:glycosyltransferase involved in cell wall biosynthesis|nr:glycosyltransferase family 1 protein [Mucilaginibacter sp.]